MDLSAATLELRKTAIVNTPNYPRFSIAVWPEDSHEYVVGVYLYLGAWAEFFENTFTDTVLYKNDWKRAIIPPCNELR
jgi:hypothetical protein